eukprot:PhM_4_TR1673/c0_g1_i1/m.2248
MNFTSTRKPRPPPVLIKAPASYKSAASASSGCGGFVETQRFRFITELDHKSILAMAAAPSSSSSASPLASKHYQHHHRQPLSDDDASLAVPAVVAARLLPELLPPQTLTPTPPNVATAASHRSLTVGPTSRFLERLDMDEKELEQEAFSASNNNGVVVPLPPLATPSPSKAAERDVSSSSAATVTTTPSSRHTRFKVPSALTQDALSAVPSRSPVPGSGSSPALSTHSAVPHPPHKANTPHRSSHQHQLHLKSALKATGSYHQRVNKALRACIEMFDIPEEEAAALFQEEDEIMKSMATYSQRHPIDAMRDPAQIEMPEELQHHVVLSMLAKEWQPSKTVSMRGSSNNNNNNNNDPQSLAMTTGGRRRRRRRVTEHEVPTSSSNTLINLLHMADVDIQQRSVQHALVTAQKSRQSRLVGGGAESTVITARRKNLAATRGKPLAHTFALDRARKQDPELFATGSDLDSDVDVERDLEQLAEDRGVRVDDLPPSLVQHATKQEVQTEDERQRRKVEVGVLVRALLWGSGPQDADEDPRVDRVRLRAILNRNIDGPCKMNNGSGDDEGDTPTFEQYQETMLAEATARMKSQWKERVPEDLVAPAAPQNVSTRRVTRVSGAGPSALSLSKRLSTATSGSRRGTTNSSGISRGRLSLKHRQTITLSPAFKKE